MIYLFLNEKLDACHILLVTTVIGIVFILFLSNRHCHHGQHANTSFYGHGLSSEAPIQIIMISGFNNFIVVVNSR